VRYPTAILTIILAIFSTHALVLVPYRLNVLTKLVQSRTLQALKMPDSRSRIIARRNVELITSAMPRSLPDSNALLTRAANFRILDENRKALSDYRKANQIEERPEIHLLLGETLLHLGDTAGAARHFERAKSFSPFWTHPE